MAIDFGLIIGNLIDIGFYNVILPFLLVYVVIFAILEKSKIFSTNDGSDKNQVKNVNSIIAFVFGLFVVASIQTVRYLQNLILDIVIIIIFILCVLILLAFIFGEDYDKLFRNSEGKVKGWISWSIGLIVFFVAIYILFNILGIWTTIGNWFNSTSLGSDFGTYLVLIIIGFIIYAVTKDDGKKVDKK